MDRQIATLQTVFPAEGPSPSPLIIRSERKKEYRPCRLPTTSPSRQLLSQSCCLCYLFSFLLFAITSAAIVSAWIDFITFFRLQQSLTTVMFRSNNNASMQSIASNTRSRGAFRVSLHIICRFCLKCFDGELLYPLGILLTDLSTFLSPSIFSILASHFFLVFP